MSVFEYFEREEVRRREIEQRPALLRVSGFIMPRRIGTVPDRAGFATSAWMLAASTCYISTILPGFRMLSGSSAALIAAM